jgi:hypothetical protein
MNVEIGTEAVQFPEKEYKNVIFVAVLHKSRDDSLFFFQSGIMAINIRFNFRGLLSIAGAFKIVELVTLPSASF